MSPVNCVTIKNTSQALIATMNLYHLLRTKCRSNIYEYIYSIKMIERYYCPSGCCSIILWQKFSKTWVKWNETELHRLQVRLSIWIFVKNWTHYRRVMFIYSLTWFRNQLITRHIHCKADTNSLHLRTVAK